MSKKVLNDCLQRAYNTICVVKIIVKKGAGIMSRRGENIYKRKDRRWEARIKRGDGQYISVYGRTYTEAKEKRNEKIKEEGNHKKSVSKHSHGDTDMDIVKQLENWLESCAKRVKLSTYENYYYCIKTYVYPYLKTSKMKTISKAELESFVTYISNNASLSYSYQNKILTIFKVALRSILQEDYKKILLEALKLPKKQTSLVQVFSFEEQRRIEGILLKNSNIKSLCILLCFYTGLRLGEIGALKWNNIDTSANTITISGTLSRKKNFGDGDNKTILYVSSPKNRSSNRQIPLPDFLSVMLRQYQTYAKNRGECFVLSNAATPMDTRTLQKYYMSILKKADIGYRKFHTIRHTFATRALEMGVDIKTVSELLGHASVTNTLNIYAHSLMEQKKKAIEKLSLIHTSQSGIAPSQTFDKKEQPLF